MDTTTIILIAVNVIVHVAYFRYAGREYRFRLDMRSVKRYFNR